MSSANSLSNTGLCTAEPSEAAPGTTCLWCFEVISPGSGVIPCPCGPLHTRCWKQWVWKNLSDADQCPTCKHMWSVSYNGVRNPSVYYYMMINSIVVGVGWCLLLALVASILTVDRHSVQFGILCVTLLFCGASVLAICLLRIVITLAHLRNLKLQRRQVVDV
jgi:hypothetical protein